MMAQILIVLLIIILVVSVFFIPRENPTGNESHRESDRKRLEETTSQKSDCSPSEPLFQYTKGRACILDGDSIVINKVEIRLFGIDAPELDHPYGQKAKWALVSLCKGKSRYAAIHHYDAYGRAVAACILPDGRDLSEEMVKLGLAIDWPKYSGGIYRQMEVPDARRKLWLADARQKGRMDVWAKFEAKRAQDTARPLSRAA